MIKRYTKLKDVDMRDERFSNEIKLDFYNKLRSLNNTMIESNARMLTLNSTDQKNTNSNLMKNLELIFKEIVTLINFHHSHKETLKDYRYNYNKLIFSWNDFTGTPASPQVLGRKLQVVKENSDELRRIVRISLPDNL